MGKVHALPGADKPIDALKHMAEMMATKKVQGFLVVCVAENENGTRTLDTYSFGRVQNQDVAMAALDIQNIYFNGDWE